MKQLPFGLQGMQRELQLVADWLCKISEVYAPASLALSQLYLLKDTQKCYIVRAPLDGEWNKSNFIDFVGENFR